MKVSFPYMGCVTGYKKILELLGHEVIMPQKPTQSTIDLGVKYSPEFICFPFKVILGTYLEAVQKGAEVILTSGGNGPCRAGYYSSIHERIVKSLGYDVEFITFDSMFRDFKTFMRKVMLMKNKRPVRKLLRDVLFCYKLISQMDNFEKELKIIRAYEVNKGETNRAWKEIVKIHDKCYTFEDLRKAKKKSRQLFDSIEKRYVPPEKRLRVGIIGEIYVVMESSTNMDIEQILNNLGAEVENVHYISSWIKHNIQPEWLGLSKSHKVFREATRFVRCNCGGHDKENLGWIIDFKRRNFDGVVHLMPFACLPELVNQSIIPNISKALDIPILSLSMDEQLGAAHNMTRIEAFIDLLNSRKSSREKQKVGTLELQLR